MKRLLKTSVNSLSYMITTPVNNILNEKQKFSIFKNILQHRRKLTLHLKMKLDQI